jgi:hypothetical protein
MKGNFLIMFLFFILKLIIFLIFIKGLLGSNENKIIKFNNNNNLFENMFSSLYYFDISSISNNNKEFNKFSILLQDEENFDEEENKKKIIEGKDKQYIDIIATCIDVKIQGNKNNISSESLLDIEINELLISIFELILMINISNDNDLLLLLKDKLNPNDTEYISSYKINDSNFNYNTPPHTEEKNYFSFNQLKNIIANNNINNNEIYNNLDLISQKTTIGILKTMEINSDYLSFLVINNPLLFSSIYLR